MSTQKNGASNKICKRDEKSKDANDSHLGTFVQNKRKKISGNKHLGNKRTRERSRECNDMVYTEQRCGVNVSAI